MVAVGRQNPRHVIATPEISTFWTAGITTGATAISTITPRVSATWFLVVLGAALAAVAIAAVGLGHVLAALAHNTVHTVGVGGAGSGIGSGVGAAAGESGGDGQPRSDTGQPPYRTRWPAPGEAGYFPPWLYLKIGHPPSGYHRTISVLPPMPVPPKLVDD